MAFDLSRPVGRVIGAVIVLTILGGVREVRAWLAERSYRAEREERADAAIARGMHLRVDSVPGELAELVPLAEKWGYPDEDVRARVAEKATPAERLALTMAVGDHRADIERWVNSQRGAGITDEVVVFVSLCEAADELKTRRP
jgi:hypothetical protein